MERRKFLSTAAQAAAIPFFIRYQSDAWYRSDGLKLSDRYLSRRDFFFKPVNAWAADFIPLYAKGQYQLFYLHDWRNDKEHGEGTPWYRISTKDFVHFTEHGEVLPRGTKEEQDLYVFTGSAIAAEGRYHIFYTGHNPYFTAQGKPQEGIMHAVSDDLQNWKKMAGHTFFAPAGRYEPNDWRDPFVFWNEEAKEYNMLCAARFKKGIPRRRGLTALCASKDLVRWEAREPFYMPGLYYTHECPDLFKMGDWWYLLFSEFTGLFRTRYRMSRSLKGPWLTPERDDFDGHAFYAAKTASDGNKRFIFGWNPTRSGDSDTGNWNWGGNLVVHEIYQQPDGGLSVRVPDTVAGAFAKPLQFAFDTHTDTGTITAHGDMVQIGASGSFGASLAGVMPDRCKIETTISFEEGTQGCGLMLHAGDDFDQTYYIRLEPSARRLVFDMWPRRSNEVSFMPELERRIKLAPGTPINLKVLVDGTVGVAYVNDEVAMDFRLYNLHGGNWGVFVQEGSAGFNDIRLFGTGQPV